MICVGDVDTEVITRIALTVGAFNKRGNILENTNVRELMLDTE